MDEGRRDLTSPHVSILQHVFIFLHGNVIVGCSTSSSSSMLLISCPACKNPVPSSAGACPWCAHPDPSHKKRNATIAAFVFGAMVVVMTVAYLWIV